MHPAHGLESRPNARATLRRSLVVLGTSTWVLGACGTDVPTQRAPNDGGSSGQSTAAGGSMSQPTAGTSPQAAGTTSALSGGGGRGGASSGSGGAPAAGTAPTPSAGGSAASGGIGGLASAGAAGLPAAGNGGTPPLPVPDPTNLDHCLFGYDPLPSDDTMASGPSLYTPPGGNLQDTILQPEVLTWMDEHKWTGAHVMWHAVRGCVDGSAAGLLNPLGFPDVCKDYPVLIPADQNCKTAGDGYQFLLFHRHMLQALQQLWPKHAADFDGFPKFPTTKGELPEVWNTADPTWNEQILAAAEIGDNIEQHLDLFPDEGALGYWLQCPVGTRAPGFAPQMPYVGLHFNLHDQWSRGSSSPHGLNNGQVNITNYMFWKLHGWIDKVWEKYRVAKGLTTEGSAEMSKYRQDLKQACNEMEIEIEIIKRSGGDVELDCPPDVDETGYFHTTVRPIFETETNHCASCHGPSQTSPYKDLTLGGSVSSKCVLERLKRPSIGGGSFNLVEPGDPDRSWLYLKASGKAKDVSCVEIDANRPCNSATMPPSGRTMSDAELEIIRQWILDGANP